MITRKSCTQGCREMTSSRVTIHYLCLVQVCFLQICLHKFSPMAPYQDNVVRPGHFSSTPTLSPHASHGFLLPLMPGNQQFCFCHFLANSRKIGLLEAGISSVHLRHVSLFFNNSIFLPVDSELLLIWKLSSLTASLQCGQLTLGLMVSQGSFLVLYLHQLT